MPTNLPKHSPSINNQKISGIAAWDDAVATWDSTFYTWSNSGGISAIYGGGIYGSSLYGTTNGVANSVKHAGSITNQTKH